MNTITLKMPSPTLAVGNLDSVATEQNWFCACQDPTLPKLASPNVRSKGATYLHEDFLLRPWRSVGELRSTRFIVCRLVQASALGKQLTNVVCGTMWQHYVAVRTVTYRFAADCMSLKPGAVARRI